MAPIVALVEPQLWKEVWNWGECRLPPFLREVNEDDDVSQRSAESASYYINGHPSLSWTDVADALFHYEQTAALEALRPFLPPKGEKDV